MANESMPLGGAQTLLGMLKEERQGETRLKEEQAKSDLTLRMEQVREGVKQSQDLAASQGLYQFLQLQAPDPMTGQRASPEDAFARMQDNPNARYIQPLIVEGMKQRLVGEREARTLAEKERLAIEERRRVGQGTARTFRTMAAKYDPKDFPGLAAMYEGLASMVEEGDYDQKVFEALAKQAGEYQVQALQLLQMNMKPGDVLPPESNVRRTASYSSKEGIRITETPYEPNVYRDIADEAEQKFPNDPAKQRDYRLQESQRRGVELAGSQAGARAAAALPYRELSAADKEVLERLSEAKIALAGIKNFTAEEVGKFVGITNRPWQEIKRSYEDIRRGLSGTPVSKETERFSEFDAAVGLIETLKFYRGGKQLTPYEGQVVERFIPTGRETHPAFVEKLNNARRFLPVLMEMRLWAARNPHKLEEYDKRLDDAMEKAGIRLRSSEAGPSSPTTSPTTKSPRFEIVR